MRPLLQTAQNNTNTTGTALKAGAPAYTTSHLALFDTRAWVIVMIYVIYVFCVIYVIRMIYVI